MRREIIKYNHKLLERAKELRKKMTLSEKHLWKYIRNKKLNNIKFDRQVVVDNFIIDFYSRDIKLAIEIDGCSHNDKQEYDEERQAILESKGIRFIRFSNNEVLFNLEFVLTSISEAILNN